MYLRMLSVLVAVALVIAQPVYAAQTGLGFVTSSGIWFSKTVFFEGETVRVMTVVVNNTYANLTGTLGFFDGESSIAEVSFSLGFEEARQISANWSPRVGQHTVTARFLTLVGKKDDGTTVALNPSSVGTAILETNTFVDSDTDRDGIGNAQDPDIDNDGLSNTEEIRRGTNVTNPDTDGDGVTDGEEVAKGTDPTRPPQPVVEPTPVTQPAPTPTSIEPAPATSQPVTTGIRVAVGTTGTVATTTVSTSTPYSATTTIEITATSGMDEQRSTRVDRPAGSGVLPLIAYATAAIAAVFAALYVRTWSRHRE